MAAQVLIGSILVSCAGLLLWWSFFADRRADRAKEALEEATLLAGGDRSFRELSLSPSAGERLLQPVRDRVVEKVRRRTPAGSVEAMQRRIHLAGVQDKWNVERLLSTKILFAVVVFLVCILLALVNGSALWLAGAVVLGIAAYAAPDGILDRRARERQGRIQDDMPDVIDQIMISVQAGLSFDAAIDRIAGSGKGPLSDELKHVVQDIRLGMARGAALEGLAERTDVSELDEFVIAMNQADTYGLSIAQVLRVQSEELRLKRKQRAEERAHKIPVKMVIPLIFCIFPTIFIAALGPAVIRAINFELN